jgi:serine/threonine-protein phosphatase 2A regulatory subunit A
MAQEPINDDFYPLALLMDELKHDDVANRVEAMQKLDTIALALGPERSRDELIPFLQEVAQDDEDEVFAVLAEQLGHFVPLIGGSEHADHLIPVLEILAATEEPIVRDRAVESLNNIATQLSVKQLKERFYPLIESLSSTEWFSSKVSSTGLFQSVIAQVDEDDRKNLLTIYSKLVHDDAPMVQRAAASHLPKIIDLFREFPDASNEEDWDLISSMFQSLTNDKQDSVKLLAVDVLISILKYFRSKGDQSHNEALLESSFNLINDSSWRVRYMAAERFEKIAVNFKDDPNQINQFVEPFLSLLKDNESEVRKVIAKQLPGFSRLIPREIVLEKILPQVEELSNDPSEIVRSSLASEIVELATLFDKDVIIKDLLPIFIPMLKDEFPEVKLNIISKLSIVNDAIGIHLLTQSLLPAISELAKDKQWRVRLAIIDYIPSLAKQLGVSIFDEELGELVMSWLWDSVYSIREAAVNNLEKLTEIFGSDWANEEIISRILKADSTSLSNFVYRLTSLFTLSRLILVVDENIIIDRILPFIDELSNDQVPNIRFNVAKSYLTISQALLKKNDSPETVNFIKEKIIPTVEKLKADTDVDVKYFANQSYNGITSLLEKK